VYDVNEITESANGNIAGVSETVLDGRLNPKEFLASTLNK
jgi:hypothetical protein